MTNNQLKYSWKMPTILGVTIFLLWIGSFGLISCIFPDNMGTIGDSFGAINALFSGLAFAGLIYTIFLQMKELELTRDELRKTSDAQQKSEKALSEQVNQMEKTAKLNALSSLILYNNSKLERLRSGGINISPSIAQQVTSDLEKCVEEIKKIASLN